MSRFYGDFDPLSTATTVTSTSTSVVAQNIFPLISDLANTGAGAGGLSSVDALTFSSAVGTPYGAGAALRVNDQSSSRTRMRISGSAAAVEMMEFSSAFTMEFWLHRDSGQNSGGYMFLDGRQTGLHSQSTFRLYFVDGKLTHDKGSQSGGSQPVVRTATTAATGAWQHYALARESDDTLRMFIDGAVVLTTSFAFTYDNVQESGQPLFFTDPNTRNGTAFYMRDLRIFKDACIYTTAFTVPSQALEATSDTLAVTSTSNTRSHSHVWNYSDVYDARFADKWPTFETGPTPLSHIVRFDASMAGVVDTAAGTWTSVTGTNHPTTLVNGTTATLLIADQNGLNVVRTNTSFVVTSADQVSTTFSQYGFAMVYSRNVTTSAQNIYPFGTGPGNNANTLGIEIHSSNTGGNDFDVAGGNSYDRTVSVAGADFKSADYTRYLIMASGNSSDGIHNLKVQVRGGTSSAVTLGTSGSNRSTAPKFLDSSFKTGAFSGAQQLDICELIFYDVELSSADMITEADRLATKWGL